MKIELARPLTGTLVRPLMLPNGAAPVGPFTDNFNRADQNLEVSSNWTHDGLIAGALAIRSNNLSNFAVDSAGSAYKCPDQGSANHYVQCTVRSAANSGPFICCRLADRNNFFGFRNSGASLEVYRRVAGTLTNLNTSAQGIVVGDVLRLECEGIGTNTTIRTYKNGVLIPAASGDIATNGLVSTRQGLVGRTTTQNPWIDNFEAGVL